jgi:hypothetical protein
MSDHTIASSLVPGGPGTIAVVESPDPALAIGRCVGGKARSRSKESPSSSDFHRNEWAYCTPIGPVT